MNGSEWPSVVESWRAACDRHPDRIAIEDGAVQWTYRDLEDRVNAWSTAIARSCDAGNVAVQMPHGAEAIAVTLGILSSGRCRISLDLRESVERRLARLQFSDSTILVSRAEEAAELCQAGWAGRVISPASIDGAMIEPALAIDQDACAYLNFTSGSSGRQKAVAGSHRTLACAVVHLQAMLEFTAADRHALLSPVEVPATQAQIFAVFSVGARLCLFDPRNHTVSETVSWLDHRRITTLQIVPSLFRVIAREAAGKGQLRALRALKLGGEAATTTDAQLFVACAPTNAVLINGLGLTEAGFNVCWWKWRPGEGLSGESLPIGRPPATLELIVEPTRGLAAGNGEIGEIVVRSSALPHGYWRNPELSAEIYRELPDRPGWRELRTGDAGFWRSDGLLEYKGRLDETVKIRGRRVVPSEIEATLSSIDGVMEAAVVAKEGERIQLHAFVQPRADAMLNSEDLRRMLSAKLPSHMVPARISLLDHLPRMPSGKIDRVQLAKRVSDKAEAVGRGAEHIKTSLHRELAYIWEDLLGVKGVGPVHDFFALGGDSLAAMTMLAAVEKAFGVNLPLSVLAEEPTLQRLGDIIARRIEPPPDCVVVPLRRGQRTPLFCVPSAGSSAFEFHLLSSLLPEDRPVFAFQSPGLDGRKCCVRSVGELAELYLSALRKFQPHDPYYLCGSSFGGRVAFEMACRLEKLGERVGFLGLLDCYGGGYPSPRKQLGLRQTIKVASLRFLPHGQRECFTLAEFRRGLVERTRRWLVRRMILIDSRLRSRVMPCPFSWRSLYVQEACFAASRRHQLPKFAGKIDLFWAEHQPPADLFENDPLLGWGGTADGGIVTHKVPGHHNMYLRDRKIASVLAQELCACLKRIETAAGTK